MQGLVNCSVCVVFMCRCESLQELILTENLLSASIFASTFTMALERTVKNKCSTE